MPWRMLLKIRHILMSMATEHRIGMMATTGLCLLVDLEEDEDVEERRRLRPGDGVREGLGLGSDSSSSSTVSETGT